MPASETRTESESAVDRIVKSAQAKAMTAAEHWREEARKNEWDPDDFLRARAPGMVRAYLVEALLESHDKPETLGGISALLENGEQRILAKITGAREPLDWRLTVGTLKRMLEKLPDCMPVFYERLEDQYFDHMNWKTVTIHSPDPIIGDMECVPAFTAYVATDEEGGKVLALTAHY